MDIFEQLNEKQAQIVNFTEGRLIVPAVPGSGKTKCVVHWIANMVKNQQVDPRLILATTFSRKGADEMNKRLESLGIEIGGRNGGTGARVGTYHSVCYDILHDGSPWENYKHDESNEMHRVLKQEIIAYNKGKGMNWENADLTKVLGYIGYCQNELIGPSEAKHFFDSRFDEAYVWYEEERHKRKLLTFDAMLFHACEFLSTDENARRRWEMKYKHVIVDEMQDTNVAQWVLADFLGKNAKTWIVVGDPDQAIFSWRGAHPERLLTFPTLYDSKFITVDINYRSRPEIEEDIASNELALQDGYRLHSSYNCPFDITKKIWIITEADRSVTTILFPKEY